MKKLSLCLLLVVQLGAVLKAQKTYNDLLPLLQVQLQKSGFINANNQTIEISSQYTDAWSGNSHIYFYQKLNGLLVLNSASSIHINKSGNLAHCNLSFVDFPSKNSLNINPKISAANALQLATANKGINLPASAMKSSSDGLNYTVNVPSLSSEPMKTMACYWNVDGLVKLAWANEFYNDQTNDWWQIIVDADNGKTLQEITYTAQCSQFDVSKRVQSANQIVDEHKPFYLGKGNNSDGSYNVLPFYFEALNRGDRQLLTKPWDATASPFGWHDTDGIAGPELFTTRGNNVWAKDDTLGNNSLNGFSPNGGDSLVFNFPFNIDAPRASLSAAATNMFYMNNVLHDIMTHYGFDEAAGNFQLLNYSGNGIGKDFVFADVQDGSGTANANFSTPIDGKNGRMQMYLWPVSATFTKNDIFVITPTALNKRYTISSAAFGPSLTTTPITGDVALYQDSGLTTSYGCVASQNNLAGKIVLIDRGGTCSNSVKVLNAQSAGAIAVLVGNSTTSAPSVMTGSSTGINIPSMMLYKYDADSIKSYLQRVTVRMVLADTPSLHPNRTYDGDFDNGVITHEFGHGISTRLTGGPANSSCLFNAEQAGEGWSDFFALAITTRPWNKTNTSRGLGTYVFDQDSNGLGIREYRYSRNMAINPVTYNYIKTHTEAHSVGFVFCSVLYDILLDMIDRYGFDPDVYNGKGGNNKAIQLIIDGLKLQKCGPGFLDSRDAILKADSMDFGGANTDILWRNFARRGMGVSAVEGSPNSALDNSEAFDVPQGITGITEANWQESLRVFPNPATNEVFIDVYNDHFIHSVELTDLNGKVLSDQLLQEQSLSGVSYKLPAVSPGLYFLSIHTNKGVLVQKLMIQ